MVTGIFHSCSIDVSLVVRLYLMCSHGARWKSHWEQISYGFMHIEYAENGSLFGFLQRSQVNIERDLKWAMEIAQGE